MPVDTGRGTRATELTTRDELVLAAISYARRHGIEKLTLRSLGQRVGMHHTAIYRHFASKDDLLAAIFVEIVGSALDGALAAGGDPRTRLVNLCLATRAMYREHAGFMPAMVASVGMLPQSRRMQGAVVAALRDLGVDESRLVDRYQAIESFVVGASYYDFAGFPDHLAQRRARHRGMSDRAFDDVSRDIADIDALNERAFRWGLEALIDAVTA